jgi:Na+/proline symporter
MTTGAIIIFIVAIIAVGLFGIYAARHKEDAPSVKNLPK